MIHFQPAVNRFAPLFGSDAEKPGRFMTSSERKSIELRRLMMEKKVPATLRKEYDRAHIWRLQPWQGRLFIKVDRIGDHKELTRQQASDADFRNAQRRRLQEWFAPLEKRLTDFLKTVFPEYAENLSVTADPWPTTCCNTGCEVCLIRNNPFHPAGRNKKENGPS